MPSSSPVQRLGQLVGSLTGHQLDATVVPSGRKPFRAQLGNPHGPVHLTPLTPVSFLLRAAQIYPTSEAISHPERNFSINYADWALRCAAIAHALKSKGINPGDRVAVISPNVPLILDLTQAVPGAQAVYVPINIRLTVAEVDYILEHSGSKMVFVDAQFKNLCVNTKIPVIVADDTRPAGDAYEAFVEEGRRISDNMGWETLQLVADEDSPIAINYSTLLKKH